jgi:hypothetical protein
MGGACRKYVDVRNTYKTLVGKPEKKQQLGIPRDKWENNIAMDLRYFG